MTWTAESLSELATGYWKSQALLAACQSGLFDALPGTAADVCQRRGVDVRVGTTLLESLVALGLLDSADGVFSADDRLVALVRQMGPALAFNGAMYGLWAKLPEALRTGAPVVPPAGHLGEDDARTRGFVVGMHSRGLALLPPVARAIDASGAARLLDVGAGPGTLGRMLADAHPKLRVTLADLPAVTRVAETLTRDHPAAARVSHVPLDYLTADIPAGHDLIVHSGALHQHAPDVAQDLISKLAAALPRGGHLYVIDLFARPDRSGPAFSLLFGLNMALVSPTSHVHSLSDVEGYFSLAGLTDVRARDVPDSLYGLVRGTRR
jgi:SAM-dependent methyltransferase